MTNAFYCRQCRETYIESDDVVLSSIAVDIQQRLSALKTKYMQTKTTLFEKMKTNQRSVEEFFKLYYDTLDTLRCEYLREEYSYRGKMATFEKELRSLIAQLQRSSMAEFYYDERELKDRIESLDQNLD